MRVVTALPTTTRLEQEEGGEELVCITADALSCRHYRPAGAGPVWSEGEGTDREWQTSFSVKVEESVCIEPNLEVDSDEEPETGGMQEIGHT